MSVTHLTQVEWVDLEVHSINDQSYQTHTASYRTGLYPLVAQEELGTTGANGPSALSNLARGISVQVDHSVKVFNPEELVNKVSYS